MGWFKRRRRENPDTEPIDMTSMFNGPLAEAEPGDWVVMPYRIAEACRISLYTMGTHPDLPAEVQHECQRWLEMYNRYMAAWFQENYGADIFPVLAKISQHVREVSERSAIEQHEKDMSDAFNRWEEQLGDGPRESPPPPTSAS